MCSENGAVCTKIRERLVVQGGGQEGGQNFLCTRNDYQCTSFYYYFGSGGPINSAAVKFSAATSPGVTLDKHAINVKSSAPRHRWCIIVIISNVRRDDKMLIFPRCGGQKPSHNICIITAPEKGFLPCRTGRVGLLFFFF